WRGAEPPVAPVKSAGGHLAEREEQLPHRHRAGHRPREMWWYGLGRLMGVPVAQGLGQLAVPRRGICRLRLPHRTVPDRGERMRLFDGLEERLVTRLVGAAAV